uniref:Uncharacterized protein n=1 Tax=Romanomermis culicivorax TaxID=13658 RepID=A0A915I6Q6_ROMCU
MMFAVAEKSRQTCTFVAVCFTMAGGVDVARSVKLPEMQKSPVFQRNRFIFRTGQRRTGGPDFVIAESFAVQAPTFDARLGIKNLSVLVKFLHIIATLAARRATLAWLFHGHGAIEFSATLRVALNFSGVAQAFGAVGDEAFAILKLKQKKKLEDFSLEALLSHFIEVTKKFGYAKNGWCLTEKLS